MIIDTNSCCKGKTDFLKSKGVTAVGRYYRVIRPEWAITKDEAQELSAAGLKLFMVYEDTGKAAKFTLSEGQGEKDGKNALTQAREIGQPAGGVIYFAVEGLDDGYTSEDLPAIRQYFAGVKKSIAGQYSLGVYADGIVCKTLRDEHICTHTWLAAASTSFEGTTDFYKSGRWTLAQVKIEQPEKDWDGLSVDLNEAKGDFGAFSVPFTGV